MRTEVWETGSQIALRSCSKEVGEGQYICDFGKRRVYAIKHIYFSANVCWSCEASANHEK